MSDPAQALTLQMLEWIDRRPRRYAEVLDAWHSTCPRLTIWEDACMDGLIDRQPDGDLISVSEAGRVLLAQSAARV